VNLVHNASSALSEVLLEEFIREGFLQDSSDRVKSRQAIMRMFRDNDVTGAAKRVEEIVRSASAIHSDVKNVAMALMARLNTEGKTEEAGKILSLLREKLPEDVGIRMQWISSICTSDPKTALLELDKIPDEIQNGGQGEFLRLLKARSLDSLGEYDAAKKLYESLLNTGLAHSAQYKLDEYRKREDRMGKSNESQSDIVPNFRWTHFVTMMIINIVGILCIYILYLIRRKRNKKAENDKTL
jgi:tetratricopeptide (TPR) repeat protein